jgi:gluconolactonase
LKVSQSGLVYATGPGGILILDKSGKHLGTVSSGEATANCALDTGEGYLYGTSDMYLIRVKLKS